MMECNKEEAFRAKGLAEEKMANKDFLGARKIALKAQNLYPELENISQLIMVCDVHCAAENKIYGTEMDWYGILQLDPTADDVLIKKQFRKFALSLHPDKNKFAGAADAFNLIGEAHRVLLDLKKRRIHDMKCKSASVNGPPKCASSNGPPKRASRPFNARKVPASHYSSVELNKQFQQAPQAAQTGPYIIIPAFWTACPFCSTRSQYYRDMLNKTLICQICCKSYIGYEINAQGVAPQNKPIQPASPKKTRGRQQASSKVGTHSKVKNYTAKVEVGENSNIGNTLSSEVAQGSKPNEKRSDVSMNSNQKRKAEKPQPRGNINGKKKKKISESSESCDSETSTESEEEVSTDIDGFYSQQFPRRSSRSKRNVSYTEDINDENDTVEPAEVNKFRDTFQPNKEAVEDLSLKQEPPGTKRSTGHDAYMDETEKEAKTEAHPFSKEGMRYKGNETEEIVQDMYEYPDPDFSDFDKNIPSFQINGKEGEGIPKGSFELDPACLPSNLEEIDLLSGKEIKSNKMHPVGSCSTFATDTMEPISKIHVGASKNHAAQRNNFADKEDQNLPFDSSGSRFSNPIERSGIAPASMEEAYEIPDPESYNFDANKSIEKFETGQVWALYSDEDGLPKYYGKIKKIDLLSEHKLHIVRLGVSSTPNDMIQWKDSKMPVTLGRFMLKKMKLSHYTSTASFSHQVTVRVESKDKKEEYIIMPRKGEVWALYKSWNAGMKCSDLKNCDYDIVEVVEENSSGISVLFLEVVNGFVSVVRAQVKGKMPVTIKIPGNELLRFSHQIPAHRLTERCGRLRGYLVLDPAGLPCRWFCKV